MEQELQVPSNAETPTARTLQTDSRLLLSLAVTAAITGGGLLVFFTVVTAVGW
ncbi:hypothetical protein [Natrinema halophilum]|uniref:Uncharacterized protein n=1 Tax=Natrinema halophilum TaxID=1699371 RepID=A0A7D5GN21_9EURY|nr:hypothetical protein [Natrinema halophilum]QLG50572.1 hypothetical protein HYG82_17840 [Natrinema halophilum]